MKSMGRFDAIAIVMLLSVVPPAAAVCPAGTDVDGDGYGVTGSALCEGGPDLDCDDADNLIHPGAVESCNGLDDNCDLLVDNAGPISLNVTTAGLAWTPDPLLAGSVYDVVRGDLSMLVSSNGDFTTATTSCMVDATTATTLSAAYVPGSGQFFYLVRSDLSICGVPPLVGTYDSMQASQRGSRDLEIRAGPDCTAP